MNKNFILGAILAFILSSCAPSYNEHFKKDFTEGKYAIILFECEEKEKSKYIGNDLSI